MSLVSAPTSNSSLVPRFSMWLPGVLAFSAGFVDAALFLAFAGFFVAQATGSFVVWGTALTTWPSAAAIKVAAIPVFFVSALLTTFLIRALGTLTTRAMVATLSVEGAILVMVMACGLNPVAQGSSATLGKLLGLAAMGVQAAFASVLLKGYGSTNVMTTNTITFACEFADSVLNREASPKLLSTGIVLGSFLSGTVVGGMTFAYSGFLCLIVPLLLIGRLAMSADSLLAERQSVSVPGSNPTEE